VESSIAIMKTSVSREKEKSLKSAKKIAMA
jgi:hypothetical protein